MPPTLRVQRLHPDARLPERMTALAAGMDLAACLEEAPEITLAPGARALIPTGLALAIPAGFEGQIRPRSGLAYRHGVTVLNAPGTIDADYRGELRVLLVNLGQEPARIQTGDRIAQLVIAPVAALVAEEAQTLGHVDSRDPAGFGSTGGFSTS
jgi:dUTP pyrophosphatase